MCYGLVRSFSIDRQQPGTHRNCILGKWYYSDGLEQFGHIPEMRELNHLMKKIIR